MDSLYRMPRMDKILYWTDTNGHKFEVLGTYAPNEDNDLWVEYRNMVTGQQYNCRLEAFQHRFKPHVN